CFAWSPAPVTLRSTGEDAALVKLPHDRAAMIQQILAMGEIAGGWIGAVGEQDEAVLVREMRADDGEGFNRHMRPRARIAVGQQAERIGAGEIGRIESPRDVAMAGERE